MKSKLSIAVISFAGILAIALMLSGAVSTTDKNVSSPGADDKSVVLHKSSSCGCCEVYGSYLRRLGYDVKDHNTDELHEIKQSLGVPMNLESCHTAEVGGYIVEGHIPEEAIQKLLAERPDIKGIGMPGMPSGSPGMPGVKTEQFVIYEITNEGERGNVFVQI